MKLLTRADHEYIVLRLIGGADQPLGSGAIREALVKAGCRVSEATVGRMLRELDFKGWTERVSFQGRVLSSDGRQRLAQMEQERERNQLGSKLIETLHLKNKDDLIEVLVARRAIEGEIARLAAINATDEEVSNMHKILDSYQHQVDEGNSGAHQDVEFHECLAKAARNKVLEAATKLIRRDTQLSPVLEFIRAQVRKSALVTDHRRILVEVEKHQPETAAGAMISHIEGLIADVEQYWEHAGAKDS